MNVMTLLLALLPQQEAPGRGTAQAGADAFAFEGGSYIMSNRSLSFTAGPGVPGVHLVFSSADGINWQPVGADQSVWLTANRGGQVKNPSITVQSTTDDRLKAAWKATLVEAGENGPTEIALTGTVDLPNRGKTTGPSGASLAKGGIALFAVILFVIALGGLLIGGVWLTLAGFKEAPLWGWICLPSIGPLAFAFLYWGLGSGASIVVAGGLLSVVGVVGAISFSLRHWDIAKVPFITYIVCTTGFAIIVVALTLGQEKTPPRDPKGKPAFYESK